MVKRGGDKRERCLDLVCYVCKEVQLLLMEVELHLHHLFLSLSYLMVSDVHNDEEHESKDSKEIENIGCNRKKRVCVYFDLHRLDKPVIGPKNILSRLEIKVRQFSVITCWNPGVIMADHAE